MTKYRVIGETEVYGHKPGETFERELSEAQEWSLMEAGAIRPVRPREAKDTASVPVTTKKGEED